ncbi:hypothetical protein, conserved [Angomonas deanei]|uniref:Uncharacterized protein n=1 Tax=Angomonas deanei TaxID=59799 RepID=A0A7G2CQZ4_9TRYP|nr:hypothetical protein, conserved [Angomonas deanei]
MWDNSMHLSLSQEKDDTQFNRLLYSGAGNNFYLRKENIPFVLFVVDCLRKFPVLIHKSVFNVMKTVWCFRHSLKDVLNNFHFLFIQFKTYESAFLTDGKAEERHGTGGVSRRVRNSVIDVLTDGKDVLNILFDTAFKIVNTNSANGGEANKDGMLEESTLFLLLYQSLINGESEPANNFSYLLKIKALHTVLLSIYQRECNVQHGDHSQASCAVCSTLSEEERIRHTLRHLLPFLTVNHFAKMEPAPYGPPSGIIKVPLYLFPSRIVFPIHVFVKRFVLDFFSFADGTPGKENFYAFSTSEVLKVLYILYHNESNPLTKSKQNKSELSFEFIKSICQVSEKALLFIVKELEMNHLVTVDHAAKSIKLIKG